MLFLYRPRQTWMPFAMPRNGTQQGAYNRQMQEQFEATRRVAPAVPATTPDPISQLRVLAELHQSGALTQLEFESAKARLLAR